MNKYGAKKTEYRGELYDSAAEAYFAQTLDMLRQAKDPKNKVMSWLRQIKYSVDIDGVHICNYIADFVVYYKDGRVEVIDVKSEFTKKLPVYRLKKKLMWACNKIKIVEA